jgi:hypothetical protein
MALAWRGLVPRKRIVVEVVGAANLLDANASAQPGLGALASL